jgi:uncharacterized protein (TIGR00369 family)
MEVFCAMRLTLQSERPRHCLREGESFTSLDPQINFFPPVWNDRIRAIARPVHVGKSVSRYVCEIFASNRKLVAQVTSKLMTLKGEKASGR